MFMFGEVEINCLRFCIPFWFYTRKKAKIDSTKNDPRTPPGAKKILKTEGKWVSKSVSFSNNCISTMEELPSVISQLLAYPSELTWLDLSFNRISSILPVLFPNVHFQLFSDFPNLYILYLHGNELSSESDLKHLSDIRSLRNLTLHGNKICELEREKVLCRLPQLKKLDFTTITSKERQNAEIWIKLNSKK
ncbi:leucine-rich repeat-containing protein 51-like [Octopus sinensis]|uniref:Leucine-rich repeat-containing protein 51 n=1 Tax=Octopus sinensis TaxID=2607531 RepID=A0A6P7U030_9MOLL|nr:leucine-rich repeat-containing protein 51-like [Octopus sinensis]